jgi:hypothetical protein
MIDLDGTTAEEVELNIYYNSSIIRVFHSFSEIFFLNVTFMNDMKNFNSKFGMFPRDFSCKAKYLILHIANQLDRNGNATFIVF